ncbi:MAG: DNA-binding protein [Methylococcus sp.]|nr:DNA-binding protein [Methylococcus sp.]
MGPKHAASSTYNRAYAACDAIWLEERLTPTIARIVARICVNSPTPISRAIQDWKADRHAKQATQEPVQGLPESVQALAGQLWQQALTAARGELETLRAGIDAERMALDAEVAEAQSARDATLREWEAFRAGAEQAITTLQAQNTALETSLQKEIAGTKSLLSELDQSRATIAELRGSLAEAKVAHTEAIQSWQARQEREHAWHLQRIVDEREWAEQQSAERLARQEERIQALTIQAEAARELRGQNRTIEAELNRLRTENSQLTQTVGRLEATTHAQAAEINRLSVELTQAKQETAACQRQFEAIQRKSKQSRKKTPPT